MGFKRPRSHSSPVSSFMLLLAVDPEKEQTETLARSYKDFCFRMWLNIEWLTHAAHEPIPGISRPNLGEELIKVHAILCHKGILLDAPVLHSVTGIIIIIMWNTQRGY